MPGKAKPKGQRRGPEPRLDRPVRVTINLTDAHWQALRQWARERGVSAAQAAREAIELLTNGEKGS